jgi:hypothetical protein
MRMCLAQAITLRRLKTDQYNGQVLCQIPAKHTTTVRLPFSAEEAAIYMAYEEKTQVRASTVRAAVPVLALDACAGCIKLMPSTGHRTLITGVCKESHAP